MESDTESAEDDAVEPNELSDAVITDDEPNTDIPHVDDPVAFDPSSNKDLLVPNWQAFRALLMTHGPTNLTKVQYTNVRLLCAALREEHNLSTAKKHLSFPCYTTVATSTRENILDAAAIRKTILTLPVNMNARGARSNCLTHDGLPGTTVQVIMPSEYAIADYACRPLSEISIGTSRHIACAECFDFNCPHQPRHENNDNIPLVQFRSAFYGSPCSISMDTAPDTEFLEATIHDTIHISVRLFPNTSHAAQKFTSPSLSGDEFDLVDTIQYIFTVQPESRRGTNLYTRSHESHLPAYLSALAFDSYTGEMTPIDTKAKEILPEAKRFLKPADLVAICSPTNVPASPILLVVVLRFWNEVDSANRHCFLIDLSYSQTSTSNIPRCASAFRESTAVSFSSTADLRLASISNLHLDSKGQCNQNSTFSPRHAECAPSAGVLSDNDRTPYVVYRFLLFTDGFNVFAGKRASGDGVYLQSLNLTSEARNSPDAVRIIGISPPGVSGSEIIRAMEPNLRTGATSGFNGFTEDGKAIKIFLDLVGHVADTKGQIELLDANGPAGIAPCHLCAFKLLPKSDTRARYADTPPSHGWHANSKYRTRIQAFRGANPHPLSRQLVGVSDTNPRRSSCLHALAEMYDHVSPDVPTTSQGLKVIPALLDPYVSNFPGPDHVWQIHFAHILTAFFKLLTNEAKTHFENTLCSICAEMNLTKQHKIFRDSNGSMHEMRFVDLFALITLALLVAQQTIPLFPFSPIQESFIRESYDLLQESTALFNILWARPEKCHSLDRVMVLRYRHPRQLRTLIATHYFNIRRLTHFPTRKANRIARFENGTSTDSEDVIDQFRFERALRKTIRDEIDRPNLHRMYELVT